MIRVLFVCHGNICRSPMAEFVLKDVVKKAGLEDQFSIASAPGGAPVGDVALSREHISPDVRTKAAGGIRTFEQAQAMLEAGADRIGASALVALYRQEG